MLSTSNRPYRTIVPVLILVDTTYSKNSSAVKKGKAKKVQVTERLKDVISL